MPLIQIKDFTWRQSDVEVTVILPIPRAKKHKTDVLTYEHYVKVNSPPFIFELFLWANIDNVKSRCSFTDEHIVLMLIKKESKVWPELQKKLNKDEKAILRSEVLNKKQQHEIEQDEKRKELRNNLRRAAVQEAIKLDSKNREHIDNMKEHIRQVASREIAKIDVVTKENALQRPFPIPLPRKYGEINVQFTKREFPTPCRESQTPLEQEWLQKQFEARKAVGFVAEDLRPEECNPQWLLEKGNSFFKVGNYLGAISAFSHAIKIGSKMPCLYQNRAAAHKAAGNLCRALEDYSSALDLLTPHVADNEQARGECHWGRASVLTQLKLQESSVPDYKEALKLLPNDANLKKEAASVIINTA